MSNYNNLKGSINNNIYENQTQQITGTVMNTILNEMTNVLGAGYQFAGVATVGMNPGGPDARVFYLAGEGIYTNFGNLQVPQGHLGILKWDSHWHLETIEGLGGGGANLTGYVSLASTDDLPDEGVATLGYLCGTNLYLYVGEGGDTKEGKYQNCGSFRGPQGIQGDTGVSVQSVVQTTTSTEDEGINIITCTLENGTQSTFQIKNGSKGSQGIQGPQGVQGEPGRLQAQYKQVETLPTASADTVDYIYLVESDTPNVYDMYYTEENQGAYSWQPLGTTAVQLSDYATKAEVSQLEAEVHNLSGKYYGFFDSVSNLPEGDSMGYAFVGVTDPLALYNFNGEDWDDTGVRIAGLIGPKGEKGDQGLQGVQGIPGITAVNVYADDGTGVPSADVSLAGQTLTITFHNIKGLQGNTGSSVSYPFTIVNNTLTDDATQALSAAQGKYLADEIRKIGKEFHEITPSTTYPGTYLNSTGTPTNTGTTGATVKEYDYDGGDVYASGFSPSDGGTNLAVAFFNGSTFLTGYRIGSSVGFDKVKLSIPANTTKIRVAGNAANGIENYPYAYTATGGYITLVADVSILKPKVENLESEVASLEDRVASISLETITPSNTYPGTYLNASGVPTATGTTGARVNEYQYLGGDVYASGYSPSDGGTNLAVAFFNENTFISGYRIGSSTGFDRAKLNIPLGTTMYRVAGSTFAGPHLPASYKEGDLSSLPVEVEECSDKIELNNNNFDAKAVIGAGKILGLGASFMRGDSEGSGNNNVWLYLLGQKVGCETINDALGGTNIMYHANRLADGTILATGIAPIADVDSVLIMHCHEKDVFTLPSLYESYSAEDYETNGIVPFSETTGTDEPDLVYAQAYDYVIKKIISMYNAKKSVNEYVSAVQQYMGQYVPKPCQIVLCTHWHDARVIFNDSIRKLAKKWGLPLVQFDKKIGFTKDNPNPSTGCQASIEYVGNVGGASPLETINGVVYGWHPMCGGTDVYIQKKMASIAGESFVKV